MFDYAPEQCMVLDALSHWFDRGGDAEASVADQRDRQRRRDVTYDHNMLSAAIGTRERADAALVALLKVGWGLGLTTYNMSEAMKYAPRPTTSRRSMVGKKYIAQAKEEMQGKNWSTSDARWELQKLVERQPWMFEVKNEPYRERYTYLQKIAEARQKQLDYRASKGSTKCHTPYDDEVMNAVGTAYYRFQATGLELRKADLRRAYGTNAPNTIPKILDEYFERGDTNDYC